jgi:hypothetical protein
MPSAHVLDLRGGMDTVWSHRFQSAARRNLRIAESRAESAGLTVDCGSSAGLVAAFYELYLVPLTPAESAMAAARTRVEAALARAAARPSPSDRS